MTEPDTAAAELEIEIRRARTPEDYRALQGAQRRAWGITDDTLILPVATMVGANLHGGLVLGAFLPDGSAAGLSFAFLGRVEGELCLYSQLTGVVPEYQGRSLGLRMKRVQREFARGEGLTAIAWTFDPLQASNARFNLNKLGARIIGFYENMYGSRGDALQRGAPTDRILVRWAVEDEPPPFRSAGQDLPESILHFDPDEGLIRFAGLPEPPPARLTIPIPSHISTLRQSDEALAGQWQAAVREAFIAALAAGYRVAGFEGPRGAQGLPCYVLEAGSP